MNKLITFLLFFCILACSEEELIIDKLEKNIVTTRSAGDGEYDLLGYGYNCFYSDFQDPLYAKAKVIDLERLQKGLGRDPITGQEVIFTPADIETSILHGKTETKTAYGSSIYTLTENLNIHATANIGDKILKLFSLDLEATINSGGTKEERNAFYRVDALKMTRRLTLPYTTPSRLKYFFTDVFLSDLKSLSGKELVEKYGTHVMTDILLGGKFSAFYTGKYTSTSATQVQEFKASSNFLMSSITANVHYDSNLFNSFNNVNIYIKTQGGSQTVTSIISQDPNGKLDNVSFDYTGWINSVSTETESLIGIGNPDTKIYLLSEFIDDPGKKKNIEFALQLKDSNNEIENMLASPKGILYNNNIETGILSENSQTSKMELLPYGLVMSRPSIFFPKCIFILQQETNYAKFKRRNNDYLDNTLKYTANKHNKTQQWEINFIDDSFFTLKNLSNNQYLSSYDLKFYNNIIANDSTFYWTLLKN
ncbi:MAC/perforin domain-containing protein [Bacteroides acidifaciens]|uniref:MAC/perforin domain-containing protein n=1 Tax=Bacteroides acidifaciens TaxID=85831 RepID=UPI00158C71F1|nr:MAC/perforin domain-containing protein [Bacteroides acidifaciens]